jgi:hypothetical protein
MPAAQEQFIGSWEPVVPTRGLASARIFQESGRLMVHLFGQCVPKPCDWGVVPFVQLPDAEKRRPDRGVANFNQRPRTTHVVFRLDGRELVIEMYRQIPDPTGKAPALRPGQYFTVERMLRSSGDGRMQSPLPE